MVDKRVIQTCEEVDAMVFSGDGLFNQEALDKFKEYLASWGRQIPITQSIIDEECD